jgi:hypothetical protein
MNFLLTYFGVYSLDTVLLPGFLAAVACAVAGIIADHVMRERGFGQIGNGILIMMGLVVGLMIAHNELGPMRPSESERVMVIATASSTAVLLICGVLKRLIMGPV